MTYGEYVHNLSIPDIKFDLKVCQFVDIDSQCRLYYRSEAPNGFYFYAAEWVEGSMGHWDSLFDDPQCAVQCLFWGAARFDGVRHMYMGDKETDNENYLYYPNTTRLIALFVQLNELEKELCSGFTGS